MRGFRFTFKHEAAWMMVFSLGIPLIGLMLTLIVFLAGWFVSK